MHHAQLLEKDTLEKNLELELPNMLLQDEDLANKELANMGRASPIPMMGNGWGEQA